MDPVSELRRQLSRMLEGGQAHLDFDGIVAGFPRELRGVRPSPELHTGWELLEHLRLAQWDIVQFSRDPKHVSPDWPEGYWPAQAEPPDPNSWETSAAAFRRDLRIMQGLVSDPATDLFTPFPHGTGQNLLRESLLVADHNAYHLGQMVLVRKALNAWPPAS